MHMEVRALFSRFVWRGINIYDVTIHASRGSRINPTLKVCEHNRAAHASFAPLVTGLWTFIITKNKLYVHSQFLCSLAKFDLANQGVQASPAAYLQYATARIWGDLSTAWFCSCKLLWRSDECVSLPCFNTQPDIFAVANCCVVTLSLFFLR